MQNTIFLFDVDGTLTPSRGKIDKSFEFWLKEFMVSNRVAFVTGSDIDKTIEQIGTELISLAMYSFNCSSNTIYIKNDLIYQSDWKCPEEIIEYLLCKLNESVYNYKYGKHIEHRIGMINFSIVGRNASVEERKKYYEWDKIYGERLSLAKDINSKWNNIQAVVGGETGIDIFKKGHDKARILRHFKEHQKFVFFGDSMHETGNDYSLAQEIIKNNRGICHTVSNWNETWDILRALYDSKN